MATGQNSYWAVFNGLKERIDLQQRKFFFFGGGGVGWGGVYVKGIWEKLLHARKHYQKSTPLNADHFQAFLPRNCLPDLICFLFFSSLDLATLALFAAIGKILLRSFCLLLLPPFC